MIISQRRKCAPQAENLSSCLNFERSKQVFRNKHNGDAERPLTWKNQTMDEGLEESWDVAQWARALALDA